MNTEIKAQQKYYKNFTEKNKDKIIEKHTCEACGGSYTYFNKTKHNKSKKHQMGFENQRLKTLLNV